ncbi:unnamed protein product [Adineta steineri]|uniref:Uncharacterized protein n=1 Tax=Adineta steineri TaxID=433720 RepID=A0A814NF73_9BILA|nr:unnamed protein product [Adineta steineri]CAF4038061.1 unnamed protein product [Adineta steineri]
MNTTPNSVSHTTILNIISISIAKKLETARQQSPDHFPKPIYVLPPVDESTSGQWEERLRKANEGYTGERVTLIPYHVQDAHWIGVNLQFNSAGQLQRAEYFDPVLASSFDDIKCHKRFNSVYPSVSLQSKVHKQHNDTERSATLTVENLLTAATEVYSEKTSSPSQQNLGEESSADSSANTSYSFFNDRTDLSTATIYSGNRDEHCDRLFDLKLEKNQFSTQNVSVTPVKVSPTTHSINDFTFNSEKSPAKLGEHKNVSYLLHSDPSNSAHDRQVNALHQLELHKILKNELDSKLTESEIENLEELETQISAKREDIATLKKQSKHKTAQQRKDSVSKLEEIQSLGESIKALNRKPLKNEVRAQKENLNTDLVTPKISCTEETQVSISFNKESVESMDNIIKELPSRLEQEQSSMENSSDIVPIQTDSGSVGIKDFEDKDNSITKEGLIDLYNDFNSLPICCDKHIIGLLFYSSVKLADKALLSASTAPSATSVTRYISPVTVNFKDIGGCGDDEVILCDTPGFKDTSGPELDIVDGIGTVRAIKKCQSVKPVVIVSYYNCADKFAGVRNLAHMLYLDGYD